MFISPKLIAFARVFNMTKEQLDDWNSKEMTYNLLESETTLEAETETKAWNFIYNRLNLLLRMFGTTLDEDVALLQSGTKLGHYRSLIIQFRVIEKTVLKEAAAYAKTRAV